MKRFDQWLQDGPLAGEVLSERERTLVNVAYNEGGAAMAEFQTATLESARVKFERILQGAARAS